MATATPTAPTPTAPDAPDAEVSEDSEDNSPASNRVKIIWPAPKNADDTPNELDFFPDEENSDKCEELGIPVWNVTTYRIPPDGVFVGKHIKLFWEAKCLREEAEKREQEAIDERDNPDKAKDLRGFKNHLEQLLKLREKFESQGIDTSSMSEQLEALIGD